MNVTSILIVNDNPRLRDTLAERFKKDKRFGDVEDVGNAQSALGYMRTHEAPQVALIDMLMPVCDGIELITQMRQEELCAKTLLIGMTGFYSDSLVKLMQNIGLAYVIAMPVSPETIYNRVCTIVFTEDAPVKDVQPANQLKSQEKKKRDVELIDTATRYMFAVGLSAQHDGFRYIRDAVLIYLNNYGSHLGITTDIYPMIARKYGITEKIVERSIRYAIESAWLRGNVENQYRLFGYTVKEDKGKPTNKECISIIAERTRVRFNSRRQDDVIE